MLIRGKAIGSILSDRVSPILMSSIPATAIISPDSKLSTDSFSNPLNVYRAESFKLFLIPSSVQRLYLSLICKVP